jgi:transposase InsO family protein
MGHQTDRRRYILPKLRKGDYNTLMKLISPKLADPAVFRLRVLNHYYQYGWKSACDAYGVGKSTLYDWKRVYEASGKNKYSLVPKSTRPHHTRTMTLNPKLVDFIKEMRKEYGNLGRAKIKPFLDEYAKSLGVKSYATTKISNIVRRKNFFFEKKKKRKKKKPLTPWVKRSPRQKLPGYIEMDIVHVWVLGRKHYFVTALDVVTRFAWVTLAKSPSSKWTTYSYRKFTKHYKHKVRVVQTDNGSEFLGEFHKYITKLNVNHEFIYPKSPKVNGYIERFNRTFKEEFLYRHELTITEDKFQQKLTKYLVWYNTKRPHCSLNMKSPIEYMQVYT